MKENKHTPGPWVFDERRNQICSAHPDFNNSLIAKIATGEDLREEHANARLIACAPELVEALEKLENAATKMLAGGFNGQLAAMHKAIGDGAAQARAILAKAKGGV